MVQLSRWKIVQNIFKAMINFLLKVLNSIRLFFFLLFDIRESSKFLTLVIQKCAIFISVHGILGWNGNEMEILPEVPHRPAEYLLTQALLLNKKSSPSRILNKTISLSLRDLSDDLDQIVGKNTWLKIELVKNLLSAFDPLVEWIDDQCHFDVFSVGFSANCNFKKVC